MRNHKSVESYFVEQFLNYRNL